MLMEFLPPYSPFLKHGDGKSTIVSHIHKRPFRLPWLQHVTTSQQMPAEAGQNTRNRFFPRCIAREDVRCDVDENLWPNRQDRQEEHSLPSVEDFLYICDDAYIKEELITMEGNILKTLYFDISIPIAYSFLRRYAKCVNAGMDTLTLARFFCETSLLEMDLVTERGSLLASACLLLALITKDLGGWTPCLQFHSGYRLSDLCPVVRKLYFLLSAPPDKKLSSVRNKYSHKVFFEVAKLPLLDLDVYEKALLCEL